MTPTGKYECQVEDLSALRAKPSPHFCLTMAGVDAKIEILLRNALR